MNAKEAKELSFENNVISKASQMVAVMLKITEACNKGEYSIWFYEDIKTDVRNNLVELGYKVNKTQFERNETMTKIEWS